MLQQSDIPTILVNDKEIVYSTHKSFKKIWCWKLMWHSVCIEQIYIDGLYWMTDKIDIREFDHDYKKHNTYWMLKLL